MTDTFLDEQQQKNLHQDLTLIASSTGELLRIARRETSPPGGRAARNPQVPSSRPPLNLGALSVSTEMHTSLSGWAQCLRDDTGIPMPTIPDEKGLAQHLRYHHHRVAQQPWAEDAAGEIAHWARVLSSITSPAEAKYIGPCQAEGGPRCRGLFTTSKKGECRTCGVDVDLDAARDTADERIGEAIRTELFTAREAIEIISDRYGVDIKRQKIDDMMRLKVNPLKDRGMNRKGNKLFSIPDILERHQPRRKTA